MTIATAQALVDHCKTLADKATTTPPNVAYHALVTESGLAIGTTRIEARFATYARTEAAACERFLKNLRRATGDRKFLWRERPEVERVVNVCGEHEHWTVRAKLIVLGAEPSAVTHAEMADGPQTVAA